MQRLMLGLLAIIAFNYSAFTVLAARTFGPFDGMIPTELLTLIFLILVILLNSYLVAIVLTFGENQSPNAKFHALFVKHRGQIRDQDEAYRRATEEYKKRL